MPVYDPQNVEYNIVNGHVRIVTDEGNHFPAYYAYPDMGGKFPAVALIHDWWGITTTERRLANLLAQLGYYTLIPDLFNGSTPANAREAMTLVESLRDTGYHYVDTALQVLETHLRSNREVAAVGLGMGGSLAYEAAITRTDLEAAVALYGFPQRYLGRFSKLCAPLLAIYGSNEPYVGKAVIARMKRELDESTLEHEVMILDGVGRDFFNVSTSARGSKPDSVAWSKTLAFLDKHLKRHVETTS